MHKSWNKRICVYISLHPSVWLVVGRCFNCGAISIHCWWGQCKNVPLWNLHFSTAKFWPCQKGELPEQTRFPWFMRKYLPNWPEAIAFLGTFKESGFWGPISEYLSGNCGLGHGGKNRGYDGSGGISILQEHKRGDFMVCCFAQEDTTVGHLLASLPVHLILPGPASFLSSPSMGSGRHCCLRSCAFLHPYQLWLCHLSPHSSLKQGKDTWSSGQSWETGRPSVETPFSDEEIEEPRNKRACPQL